jgi:hypothetical protein
MECLAFFLLIVVGGSWALIAVAARWARRSRQRRLYTQLAKQFKGLYDSGGLFSNPSVRLRYGETWGTVTQARSQGPFRGPCFQVRVHWPHVGVLAEVFTRSHSAEHHSYARVWPNVEVDQDFSRSFETLGPETAELRQLLSSGVRWQIERLSSLGPVTGARIVIRDGTILAQKPVAYLRSDIAAQFVQGTLELYDQCMLAKAVGIQFLHIDEAQPLDHVICKVCGEEIQDEMVVCRRCKTPHHLDCWQYTGACSIFACRETKYLLPATGHSVPRPSHAADTDADPQSDSTSSKS